MLVIDGSQGEGGGQVLRTSLSLSALTGIPVRIDRIRAGRRRPGLLRQHLTAVRAAAEVCGAEVEGGALGSRSLSFTPGVPRAGSYTFSVGTAGSACLVCQTVLPILARVGGASELCFEGGTHNNLAPPYDFLERIFFPLLLRLGVELEAELIAHGFYPAGGGVFRVSLGPTSSLRPLDLLERREEPRIEAWALSARLPDHVATRELAVVREAFSLPAERCRALPVRSPGPGNALCILLDSDTPELVTAFGERRKPAERVAKEAVRMARRYLEAAVPVGEHLADQLVLWIALAGGAFRTLQPSPHTRTNIAVVRAFLGEEALRVERGDGAVLIAGKGI
jgi:RNA 3'-terminal phosphate cyclase (ATP)